MALTRTQSLQTLGLSPGASVEEIKQAYRKMAMKHHPDRGGNEEEFKKIKEAYETLEKKESEKKPFQFHRDPNAQSFEDFLNAHYRWNNADGDEWVNPKGPRALHSTIQISLKEAFDGCVKTAVFTIIGDQKFAIEIPKGSVPGRKLRSLAAKDRSGQDIVIHTELDIKLDKGEKVTWAKEPNIYSGGVEGSGDIEIPTKINWLDIMLGRHIVVETIDGATLQVRVLPGIEAGQRIRIKGRGYWKDTHENQRGDLYLRVIPIVPKFADVALTDLKIFLDAVEAAGEDKEEDKEEDKKEDS